MRNQPYRLVLASQSPRRRQLLHEAGYRFDVIPPHESAESGFSHDETPQQLVERLARQKAANVAPAIDYGIVLGCDTIVECRGQVLGKPRDRQHAGRILRLLRGHVHHVYSGLCLWRRPDDQLLLATAVSRLQMEPISDQLLEQYLDSGGWQGKAGAFGYQDRLGWIQILSGSESNVVGLPLELLSEMLTSLSAA